MPQLIETPEGWFRTRQKDLYVLKYRVDDEFDWGSNKAVNALNKKYKKDQKILSKWFSVNLPETKLEIVGPSEYSGYIIGGPSSIVTDFNETSLAAFHAAWGNVDSPWQVELESYDKWLAQARSCYLLPAPLTSQQRVRWWDTPVGIILMSASHNGFNLSRWDAMWRLRQLVPELKDAGIDDYPYGQYVPKNERCLGFIWIDYGDALNNWAWEGNKYKKDPDRINKLRAALGIPKDEPIQVVVGD